MKRCGSRFLQILVFLLLRCTMAQNLCGSKYICGDGTECVFFFCPCVESSEKDPWEIREGEITDGRLTLYCRKLCNMDTPVCPANRLCSTNQWNRSYCECPPGLVPSMFGQCVDPNATSTIPSTTGKTAPTTSVTQKSTATTGVTTTTTSTTTSTTTRNPTSNISQRATATTGATTTGKCPVW
ncbi:salivary glue protein Sgs-3-like [Liolophura sinensis]|uniref:salivary glue protein Sgs-3-like n=1 Tax=Liolophura sinensis TaxID=3198878 RepID=UPI00315910C8